MSASLGQPAPTRRLRLLAALAMLGSVTIYGVNFVANRHAILNGFTPYDLAALRFGFAGLILLPLFLARGGFADCAGIGWGRGIVLAGLSGVPMFLLQVLGLSYAPAAHGAVIGPGTVVLVSLAGTWLVLGAQPTRRTLVGVAAVLAGLAIFGAGSATSASPNVLIGDLCFVAMGLIWGWYPIAIQKWRIDPLTATAVLCVLSMVYLPIYWLMLPSSLASVPLGVIAFHAFNQAILNMILGLWLWGWAARTIGAEKAGLYPPLMPVIGTLVAIPVLGEWPGPFQASAAAIIVAGLVFMAWRR